MVLCLEEMWQQPYVSMNYIYLECCQTSCLQFESSIDNTSITEIMLKVGLNKNVNKDKISSL